MENVVSKGVNGSIYLSLPKKSLEESLMAPLADFFTIFFFYSLYIVYASISAQNAIEEPSDSYFQQNKYGASLSSISSPKENV